jgi:hypothetical protein
MSDDLGEHVLRLSAAPQQLKADRAVVAQAAHLRHQSLLAGCASLQHKELAFGLALILDEIASHWRDLDDELRQRVVEGRGSPR